MGWEFGVTNAYFFSRREELANAITHGVGSLLSIAGLVLLVVYASINGTALHIVSAAIFGATMTLLYVNSTLLHSFPQGNKKIYLRSLTTLPYTCSSLVRIHRFSFWS